MKIYMYFSKVSSAAAVIGSLRVNLRVTNIRVYIIRLHSKYFSEKIGTDVTFESNPSIVSGPQKGLARSHHTCCSDTDMH